MSERSFDGLLGAIYEAALEPQAWQRLVPTLAQAVGAQSCSMHWRTPDFVGISPVIVTQNIYLQALQAYVGYYGKIDPWAIGWLRCNQPALHYGSELAAPRVVAESEYYRDPARHIGTFYLLGAAIRPLDAAGPTLSVAFHRAEDASDFSTLELRNLNRLLPHLQRATSIGWRLASVAQQATAAHYVLDRLSLGLVIVDFGARVLFANRAGERVLRDGGALSMRAGRVFAREPDREAELQEQIRRAIAIAAGGRADAGDVVRLQRRDRPALSLFIAPLCGPSQASLAAGAAALLVVHDPETQRPPAISALAKLLQLSRAEARLLAALLEGERIADYAERAGISADTARTQLKQLFAKTDTNHQSELTRLATGNLAAMLAQPGAEAAGVR
jgi:DNA-binding CsgD family transcriptional regulator